MKFYFNWHMSCERSNLIVWPFTIPVPVEVEVHTVPDFKAPINVKADPRGPEHSDIFIF